MAGSESCPGQTVPRALGRYRLTSFAHGDAVQQPTATSAHFHPGG